MTNSLLLLSLFKNIPDNGVQKHTEMLLKTKLLEEGIEVLY